VAAELGAGYVIEGSVRKSGNKIRITAQLLDANGKHLWAEKYDKELADIFEIQDQITHSIVEAIAPEIIESEVDRLRYVPTENWEAWDYVLKAIEYERADPDTVESVAKAQEYARKALDLDDQISRAYVVLAHSESAIRWDLPDEYPPARVEQAKKDYIPYLEKAREVDPFNVSLCSCLAIAYTFDGQLGKAREEHETALEMNPSSAAAHSAHAFYLYMTGDFEQALEETRVTKRLDPKSEDLGRYLSMESLSLMGLDKLNDSVEAARRTIRLDPDWGTMYVHLARMLWVEGRREEAEAVAADLKRNDPDFDLYKAPFFDFIAVDGVERNWLARLSPEQRQSLEGLDLRGRATHVLADLGWEPPPG
jgi:tetratricopeptide (TPR) repeat protein